jgi:hypothetical protein
MAAMAKLCLVRTILVQLSLAQVFRGTTGETFASISTGNTLMFMTPAQARFRFYVHVNGGISNYSANNINLSDERERRT